MRRLECPRHNEQVVGLEGVAPTTRTIILTYLLEVRDDQLDPRLRVCASCQATSGDALGLNPVCRCFLMP